MNKFKFYKRRHLLIISVIGLFLCGCNTTSYKKQELLSEISQPNVLFISIDDLNDWVGYLDEHPSVKTPNLDKLAARGVAFSNAHCPAPLCNPSRSSVLTGIPPSVTGVYTNAQVVQTVIPNVVTIPKHFKQNGYKTYGGGKVFHHTPGFNIPDVWDHFYLWNESAREMGWTGWYQQKPDPEPTPRPFSPITKHTKRNFDAAPLGIDEALMPDYKVASWAVDFLGKEQTDPFFLAVGMFRPHIPWFNPKKYFDMYSDVDIKVPEVKPDDLDDLSEIARKWAVDRSSRHDLVKDLGIWEDLVKAYLASITFADAQVGRVLDALEKSPYADNTIIVLWSDHGYHLGEKQHWHKTTLWERATKVPLIIAGPNIAREGTVCQQPVSLIDLFPTLIELCGLPNLEQIEGYGRSIVPLLNDPNKPWPYPAITTHNQSNHAVRSRYFRYIRYSDGSEELYDHRLDPNEWNNLAKDTIYSEIISDHKKWLPKVNAAPAFSKTKFRLNPKTNDWKWAENVKGDSNYIKQSDLVRLPPGQY